MDLLLGVALAAQINSVKDIDATPYVEIAYNNAAVGITLDDLANNDIGFYGSYSYPLMYGLNITGIINYDDTVEYYVVPAVQMDYSINNNLTAYVRSEVLDFDVNNIAVGVKINSKLFSY